MAEYHLTSPLSEADVRQLKIGDTVYLSGPAFTCRSRLHRYVFDEGHPFPFEPQDGAMLIHNGPIIIKEDGKWKLMSFMPTSSIRFEKWGARSVEHWKLRLICGKTTMGSDTAEAMKKFGCVHVSPQSVSPFLWVDSIQVEGVDLYDELGSIEAPWHFKLNELGPFVVDMDCEGNNLFDDIETSVHQNRKKVYKKLGIPADFEYTKLYSENG